MPAKSGSGFATANPPQLDAVLMTFRGEMLQALAERTSGVDVETTIRVRRPA